MATMLAWETARKQRRVIIGQKIQNNDTMQQIIMNIHNSSKLNEAVRNDCIHTVMNIMQLIWFIVEKCNANENISN